MVDIEPGASIVHGPLCLLITTYIPADMALVGSLFATGPDLHFSRHIQLRQLDDIVRHIPDIRPH